MKSKAGEGGTLFLPGSHKANFQIPEVHRQTDSLLFETYSCPPGSVIIFTENLCHSGVAWQNPDRPRVAIFNCYNFVGCQFHKPSVPKHVIEGLPPEKQAYFRNVWVCGIKVVPTMGRIYVTRVNACCAQKTFLQYRRADQGRLAFQSGHHAWLQKQAYHRHH